jgi:hypothetical protein
MARNLENPMTTWNRTAGDVKDTIVVTLDGVATLTGVSTVVPKVTRNGALIATLSAAVTDVDDRTVTIQLGDTGGWLPTATPNVYELEYEVTYVNGAVLTWPSGRKDRIVVWAQAV